MTTASVASKYTITLDDQRDIPHLLQKITGVPTEWHESIASLRRANIDANRLVAIFFDIDLGDGTKGLDIIPEMRQRFPTTPFFVVTGEHDPEYIIQAFDLGAIEFIRKPLIVQDVQARFQARTAPSIHQPLIPFGDIRINTERLLLEGPRGKIEITPIELKILRQLAVSRGQIISKADFGKLGWDLPKVSNSAMLKKAHELRAKLEYVTSEVKLRSIRGRGFQLITDQPAA